MRSAVFPPFDPPFLGTLGGWGELVVLVQGIRQVSLLITSGIHLGGRWDAKGVSNATRNFNINDGHRLEQEHKDFYWDHMAAYNQYSSKIAEHICKNALSSVFFNLSSIPGYLLNKCQNSVRQHQYLREANLMKKCILKDIPKNLLEDKIVNWKGE